MPNVPAGSFPVVEDVTQLWRSLVNDTFPGLLGAQGRIATDDAPFTLPLLNNAITSLARKMRNGGVTFPIRDYFTILNLPPVVQADPSVFVYIGFDGYSNGTQMYGNLTLPGDCMQVYVVRQRINGSNLPFNPMQQSQQGLASGFQNQLLGMWEWRQYRIYMNGSLQAQDIMLRYQVGQPPINVPAADFDKTPIYIQDCNDALAYTMAADFGASRGAADSLIARMEQQAAEAYDEMINEYVRRQQTVNYRRPAYQGGGSNATEGSSFGSTGEW